MRADLRPPSPPPLVSSPSTRPPRGPLSQDDRKSKRAAKRDRPSSSSAPQVTAGGEAHCDALGDRCIFRSSARHRVLLPYLVWSSDITHSRKIGQVPDDRLSALCLHFQLSDASSSTCRFRAAAYTTRPARFLRFSACSRRSQAVNIQSDTVTAAAVCHALPESSDARGQGVGEGACRQEELSRRQDLVWAHP